ncbi:hypothetical protein DSM106972_053760 [Dulcicalothrix desertica PCC 7102]|uniref:DUF4870 domain-containing protein n=1 Tax=Dulcicalothrix desertica PCC 7102 TaxID=232991 RepID=A0A3S1CGJ5_9CYAN|nr:DUF4870 domain-containing protein [Dulcicalothrix desertica]RUT03068.1 hypothetical protein DSM106972_053760 [Dulcicalothrix desertica PCC 7102]TWH53445.1 hypothetical protein CAL7102_01398 [Dulcicalothrix desertica PCC 7102]
MYDTDKRKVLSALCHGAIFFSMTLVSVAVPIFITFVTNDPVVRENAKESINFHINVWVYGFILGILISMTWGVLVPVAGIGFIVHWGLTILALFYVLSDTRKPFRYPLIFRLV